MRIWWRSFVERRLELGPLGSILFALICVALASIVRATLGLFGPTLPFATFFPAVLISALFGGRLAGLLSIPLSIVAVWWAFVEPYYEFNQVTPREIANYCLFAVSGLLVVWLALGAPPSHHVA